MYPRRQRRPNVGVALPEEAHESLREDFICSTGVGVHLQLLGLLVADEELMQPSFVSMQK
jgi:hypothetical protein